MLIYSLIDIYSASSHHEDIAMKSLSALLLLLLLSINIYSQQITRDIPYGAVSTSGSITLDVYEPTSPSTTPRPLIIFVHGGGFSGGDKSQAQGKASIYTDAGFVFASINYRLSGEAPFPAAPMDVLTSVRYFRANAAKWNIDPNRIGLYGTSAGATLAVYAAVASNTGKYDSSVWGDQSSRVGAAAGYFGPMDFVNVQLTGAEIRYLGGTPQEKPDVAKEASPVFNVDPTDPPIILFHGENDPVVPVKHSELMFEALQNAGVPSSFTKVINAGHGFTPIPQGSTVSPSPAVIEQQTLEFFKKYLVEQVPDITPPTVTDVTVNGGQEVTAGQASSITWNSSDNVGVVSHELSLSTDGGANFDIEITKPLAGTIQSFSWSVPSQMVVQNAVVGVLALDANGNRRLGRSPNFIIKAGSSPDITPPTVTDVSLNATKIIAGESYTVSWKSSDENGIASHDIFLSLNGGGSFDQVIASGLAGTLNTSTWKIPEGVSSDSAVIAVQASDPSGNKKMGLSAPFRIEPFQPDTTAPVVSGISVADGAKKVKRGTSVTVRWQTVDDREVGSHRLLLSSDGGTTFPIILAEGLAADASSFVWQVDEGLNKSKNAVIRVEAVDKAGNRGGATSSIFKIR